MRTPPASTSAGLQHSRIHDRALGRTTRPARVTAFDTRLDRLRHIEARFEGRVTTLLSSPLAIATALREAKIALLRRGVSALSVAPFIVLVSPP